MFPAIRKRPLAEYRHLLFAAAATPLVLAIFVGMAGRPLLAPDSIVHYAFAIVASVAFIAVIPPLFATRTYDKWSLIGVFLFTGVVGMLLLSGIQWLAAKSRTVSYYGSVDASLLWHMAKLIDASYRTSADPDANFLLSLLAYIGGVGLCEEFVKIIPVWFVAEKRGVSDWNHSLIVGLVSGVAFGVAEGIHYSVHFYNGIEPLLAYLVRFVSCVGLHAAFTGAAALAVDRYRDKIFRSDNVVYVLVMLVRQLLPVITLHALYDTLLKTDRPGMAVLTTFVAFGWLAFQLEFSRAGDVPRAERLALTPRTVRGRASSRPDLRLQAEADQILAKVSEHGMDALNPHERATLKRVARQSQGR